ncbi:MAG: AAA family ATPase [Peptococcaceae bacterium MAG4]|nr:AAA family ATPase [Peptococcaceae bacterium MAG4]
MALIDTERGSGELYAHLGEYDVCSIEAPFTPEKYIEAIRAAEGAGYDTIIIDSLSHAWAGPGGVLDIHGHAADKSGNSWTAWRLVTPRRQ